MPVASRGVQLVVDVPGHRDIYVYRRSPRRNSPYHLKNSTYHLETHHSPSAQCSQTELHSPLGRMSISSPAKAHGPISSRTRQSSRSAEHALGKHLFEAAEQGNPHMVESLLRKRANPHWKGPNGRFPLLAAAKAAEVNCVHLLIAHGADPSMANRNGVTALHIAAAGGAIDCLRALVAAQADVHIADDTGTTAIEWAKRMGHTMAAEFLASANPWDLCAV